MTHTIGVIGIGHWFERLHKGMIKTDEIELIKVASASGLEKHKAQLERLKLPDFDYYRIEPGRPVPEEFFDGVDIVHISDPNEFHAAQTLQSLKKGKITITEKTYGVNREEFENVMNYIKANNLENRSYLHLQRL
ncbi:MAG: Gfo/Idh/MocA family oxidoreductase, partial [Candidatus Marsarchaeota archaeon]|nr:Gfo/Idh/MocA family oxidoreductase [Candidatus Marsarchaeota archaeon]